ncbi:hypothetical protein AXG93_2820s1070 [Marchantia polymorpha subsp. ruderalis]|uniref:Uncharacterized protein n=1 Tax=Marchantia polymorpha subsp. ruderalis TaxID=1480154 RepID=A0A176VYM6_MARPO|nr:hypothetical protein AXG93_2820s1070 [Marchantia polymorpha subsp. ruderalis]
MSYRIQFVMAASSSATIVSDQEVHNSTLLPPEQRIGYKDLERKTVRADENSLDERGSMAALSRGAALRGTYKLEAADSFFHRAQFVVSDVEKPSEVRESFLSSISAQEFVTFTRHSRCRAVEVLDANAVIPASAAADAANSRVPDSGNKAADASGLWM